MTDREILLELIFRALIDIRVDAFDNKSPKAFKLADLVHNVPKQLLLETSESEILQQLRDRARLKGIEPWLDHALAEVTKSTTVKSA